MMKKRLWLMGGSSGIGLALVKQLLHNDYALIVSSRKATQEKVLVTLQERFPLTLHLVDFDVQEEKIDTVVQEVFEYYQGLDVFFYNVGSYEMMSIHQWDMNHIIQMNQTNYLGAVRVMNTLLPHFKRQGYGHWVLNISLSSYIGLPKGGAYSAPKAALLNFAQAIYLELKSCGIDLQVINHGFVQTRLTNKNDFIMPQLMSPQTAAHIIYNHLQKTSRPFEITFPRGLTLGMKLLSLLPYPLLFRLLRRMTPK